jgi:superfamily II DNA helicase RecQ
MAKTVDESCSSQQQQQQKRAKVVPTDHMEAATPSLSLLCQEASSREASLEAAVRTVLSMPADQPVTYRSADQKRALDAVVRGVSPLIVVLPTGGEKTLLPLTVAVLGRQQQRDQPSVTVLVLPFRALIEDLLVCLAQASISAVEWQPGLPPREDHQVSVIRAEKGSALGFRPDVDMSWQEFVRQFVQLRPSYSQNF